MFGFKKYKNSIIAEIIDIIGLSDDDKTDELLEVFAEFNASMDRVGIISLDKIFKEYRKMNLNHREAALSMIDGTISQMKSISQNAELSGTASLGGELERIIPRFEQVVDCEFRRSPGRIVPRNGSTGRAIAADSDLQRFLQ